ncbi:hypothetical protein AAAK52_08465, partial [Clostridioides difficile]
LCKNRRNYGDGLWRISKTYFSMQNSVKQEPCDFSHGRFRLEPLKKYLNKTRFGIVRPVLTPDLGACLLAKKKYYSK